MFYRAGVAGILVSDRRWHGVGGAKSSQLISFLQAGMFFELISDGITLSSMES